MAHAEVLELAKKLASQVCRLLLIRRNKFTTQTTPEQNRAAAAATTSNNEEREREKKHTYIFHHHATLPRRPIPMPNAGQPLLGIDLQQLRRKRRTSTTTSTSTSTSITTTVRLDILIGDLLDFEGDPDALGVGAEGAAVEG
jgi:hypothetical protein